MVKGLLHRTAGDAALERAKSSSGLTTIDELYAMRELQAQHTAMKQHTRSLGTLTREEAVGLLETLTSTLFSEYYDFSQARLSGKALLSATDADLKAAGIDVPLHRRRLLLELSTYRSNGVPTAMLDRGRTFDDYASPSPPPSRPASAPRERSPMLAATDEDETGPPRSPALPPWSRTALAAEHVYGVEEEYHVSQLHQQIRKQHVQNVRLRDRVRDLESGARAAAAPQSGPPRRRGGRRASGHPPHRPAVAAVGADAPASAHHQRGCASARSLAAPLPGDAAKNFGDHVRLEQARSGARARLSRRRERAGGGHHPREAARRMTGQVRGRIAEARRLQNEYAVSVLKLSQWLEGPAPCARRCRAHRHIAPAVGDASLARFARALAQYGDSDAIAAQLRDSSLRTPSPNTSPHPAPPLWRRPPAARRRRRSHRRSGEGCVRRGSPRRRCGGGGFPCRPRGGGARGGGGGGTARGRACLTHHDARRRRRGRWRWRRRA